MHKLFLIASLLFWPLSVCGEIYRWIDDQGNLHLSNIKPAEETEIRDLQKIVVPPTQTVPAFKPPTTPTTAKQTVASKNPYKNFVILSPEHDTSIRNNAGNLTIITQLEPALRANDTVTLYLDDEPIAVGQQTSFPLFHVDRGTHTIHAAVSDKTGTSLITSAPVTFHLLRVSILRKPQNNTPSNWYWRSTSR